MRLYFPHLAAGGDTPRRSKIKKAALPPPAYIAGGKTSPMIWVRTYSPTHIETMKPIR